MRKLTVFVLLLSMLFAIAGCGEEAKPKTEESKAPESEATSKAEESKAEESKAEETKAEETKAEETKAEETKAEETKAEETKAEETKAKEDTGAQANENYHIGVVTATISQAEDAARAAEALVEKYGEVHDGGRITHVTFPDNFASEMEVTIGQITSLADDPDMKMIVVIDAVPGTTAAFKTVREKRPDILLLAMSTQEDPHMIEEASDVCVDPDQVSLGYLIPRAAEKMGAKTFVHVSFPRHMSIELLSLRHDIMKASCQMLGINFVDETAPDPVSDVGVTGAQQYILENVPKWVQKYGKDTAFFCTNDAHTEPLLKKVAEEGAIFVQQDLPSPILGYPGAFGLDLKDVAGDFPAIVKKTEEAVVAAGGGGRMGTWAYSVNYSGCMAMIEYGMRCIRGEAEVGNVDDVIECFRSINPDASWNGFPYVDPVEKEGKGNHAMVYQDLYVFGTGFMGMSEEPVPDVLKLRDADKEGKIEFGQREFEGVGPKDK